MKFQRLPVSVLTLGTYLFTAYALSACNSPVGSASGSTSQNQGSSPTVTSVTVSPGAPPRTYSTDALLFTGAGTWGTEISSLESLLSNHGATFQEVSSAQLEAMSPDEISQFGVMIFPGGEGATEAGSLSAETHAKLRLAVQQQGVSYLGICAGAFIAVAPAPSTGQDVSYGVGVVDGPVLDYYFLENQGTDIAMTLETFPDGSTRDILWYGGPITPNNPGGVIAKYPDGNPAISQIWSGKGLVILSGVHPTATQNTLNSLGVRSTDGTHLDFAWDLINAAIHQQPLKAF